MSKTVQVFLDEVRYAKVGLNQYDNEGRPPQNPKSPPYYVLEPMLVRLSKRMELAMQMRVLGEHSSSLFQV